MGSEHSFTPPNTRYSDSHKAGSSPKSPSKACCTSDTRCSSETCSLRVVIKHSTSPSVTSASGKDRLNMKNQQRDTRPHKHVSYVISSDSEDANSASPNESTFSSPENIKNSDAIDLLETDSGSAEETGPSMMPPRSSSAGHALRKQNDLKQSLRARENGDKRRLKRKIIPRGDNKHQYTTSQRTTHLGRMAENKTFRHEISSVTACKRANFYIAHKDVFLPLLPKGNLVEKLVERRQWVESAEENATSPYEKLDKQPTG